MFDQLEKLKVEDKVEVPQVSNFIKLLPFKAHYFILMSGNAAIYPYIFIYAKQLGITADVVGYITAAIWCITVLSRPLIGGLADYFHKKFKLVLVILLIINIISDLGLSFIPQSPLQGSSNPTTNSSVICHNNHSFVIEPKTESCEKCCPLTCLLCEDPIPECGNVSLHFLEQTGTIPPECSEDLVIKCLDGAIKQSCNATGSDSSVTRNGVIQVSLFGIFVTLFMASVTSLDSLADAATAKNLGDEIGEFGKQRLWGTLGWAIMAFAAGALNHAFSAPNGGTNYIPGFYLSIVFYVLDIFIILKLQLKIPKMAKNMFKNVAWLLLKPRVIIFLLEATAAGFVRGIYLTYSLWFLENIGASAFLLGSVTSVQCFLGEIPFLFFSGWIIEKIGHLNVFTMSFVAQGVRFLAYSFLENPWWGLLIEILQGPSFGSFYAGLTAYGKLVAPPGAEATIQGISLAALDGVGTSVGTLMGGYWVHHAGAREAFYQAGIWSMGFAMMSCILNGLIMCNIVK